MHRQDLGLYSHPKEVVFIFFGGGGGEAGVGGGGMESEPMLTPKGPNSLYRKLREESSPRRCIMQDSEPNTLPTELFRPRDLVRGLCFTVL